MLLRLQVRDFAIIDQLELEFAPGMTVLTGETGAGKSILVDALGLVLGERCSGQIVRRGAKRAEFSAEFDISALPGVRRLLEQQALDQDDECLLLRRVVSADGRSRAFVNGNAATVQQLKLLGESLLDIHGQHFHQSLLRRPVQRDLLDHFGGLLEQSEATDAAFVQWRVLADQLQQLLAADANRESRLELLNFQLSELEALALTGADYTELLTEREKFLHSGRIAEGVSHALVMLADDETDNAGSMLADAIKAITPLVRYDGELLEIQQLLESASIQLGEAAAALQQYGATLDMDPARRDWVEERLDAIQAVARKHRIGADQIPVLHERLKREHDELMHAEERGQQLDTAVRAACGNFQALAESLSSARSKAAKRFSTAVTAAMSGLGMPGGKFDIQLSRLDIDNARPSGLDEVDFLISANPGQALQPLARIASGGELSRMSLAVQVIASDGSCIPTMVFDEVDSGVGGSVAEMVGRRLQELGARRQVLCVTHLPQVASLADAHVRISKVTDGKATRTGLRSLGDDERIQEIARMLGGVEITQKTIDHAAEMLAGARRKTA
ncbi:MAG: DNA repair protein RecN [Gammaproteobacteria bacterium]|nr:DNA repair protein RecN [Gammaproteobacteria bacterium]MDH5303007.1 DNA repair protein RecN [Gammaproteobacteria bacterium]MDH5321246.1 DNA repair protein RecN [Gammaproteobacteria bacterium]